MITRMTTRSGRQRSYDHRLRDLVQRTGDLTIATDLGVPRSTARGWLGATPRVVVTLETADLTEPELRQEILKLRRRVEKLAALLRLALALLRGLRVQPLNSAATGGRSQAAHPERHRSRARLYPVASSPPLSAAVAQSVSHLAPTADRVRAQRSVVLSSHVPASTDVLGGPGDRRHGPGA
jgi:hypothetical protein